MRINDDEYNFDMLFQVFDNYAVHVNIADTAYTIGLFDTAGQEDYDRIRPLSYPETDIFLVCFSVVRPSSYYNAKDKWIPEIRHHMPNCQFIVVGTQMDLRADEKTLIQLKKNMEVPVTKEQGERLAREEKGGVKYLECSAFTQVSHLPD